jgi:hypothetical protein
MMLVMSRIILPRRYGWIDLAWLPLIPTFARTAEVCWSIVPLNCSPTSICNAPSPAANCWKKNPEALWDDNDNSNSNNNNVRTLRTYRGKRIDADRFEGYVTVISIVPLLPGMAVYFYEMMEHLHSVFAPTVEFVVIPLDLEQGIHISLREHPSVVVLEEESASVVHTHPWLRHLTSITPRTGAATKDHHDTLQQVPLQTDRVNTYIVSADGYYIERLTSPTMAILQQKIAVYLKTIDYEL